MGRASDTKRRRMAVHTTTAADSRAHLLAADSATNVGVGAKLATVSSSVQGVSKQPMWLCSAQLSAGDRHAACCTIHLVDGAAHVATGQRGAAGSRQQSIACASARGACTLPARHARTHARAPDAADAALRVALAAAAACAVAHLCIVGVHCAQHSSAAHRLALHAAHVVARARADCRRHAVARRGAWRPARRCTGWRTDGVVDACGAGGTARGAAGRCPTGLCQAGSAVVMSGWVVCARVQAAAGCTHAHLEQQTVPAHWPLQHVWPSHVVCPLGQQAFCKGSAGMRR